MREAGKKGAGSWRNTETLQKMRNSPLHSPSPPQITYLRLTCCFLIDFPPVEELSKGLR